MDRAWNGAMLKQASDELFDQMEPMLLESVASFV
jgi:hypothetical protein